MGDRVVISAIPPAPARPSSERRPKGYYGVRHEGKGSCILAVVRILKLPEQVLGAEEAQALASVDPDQWYPIAQLLSVTDQVERELGHYGLLRMGRMLFELSHKERTLRESHSARSLLFMFDELYRSANRGIAIGGWKVLKFEPGYVELEKTTPHHCVMEQGLLSAALAAVGCPGIVTQRECFRQGAESCIYAITSSVTDQRWCGAPVEDRRSEPPPSGRRT